MMEAKLTAFDWVTARHRDWSQWNAHIWNLAETAWRANANESTAPGR